MLVALLREFARRTTQEHRENLQSAHSQLRLINSIARETLITTREFSLTTPLEHDGINLMLNRTDIGPRQYWPNCTT